MSGKSSSTSLKTIAIGKSVDVTQHVATYEEAREILLGTDRIAVAECACRKKAMLKGRSCSAPLEACFMFGSTARYAADTGAGREIDKEEALAILKSAHEAGLVAQPATSLNPGGMCNCCGCCCAVLTALKSQPRPSEMVRSSFLAQVDPGCCTGCGLCAERCQMDAASLNAGGLAEIDPGRCIGCGLCASSCPEKAVRMVPGT